jgi:hypothetical protein
MVEALYMNDAKAEQGERSTSYSSTPSSQNEQTYSPGLPFNVLAKRSKRSKQGKKRER